jgi:glutathione S-transferase
VLTEAGVCIQYVADQAPNSGLAPAAGTLERYRLMEWLNYIAAEVHKQFGPLFNPTATADVRKYQVEQIEKRLDYLSKHFANSEYVMGRFTVADAYLFNILSWTGFVKIDLSRWPAVQQYLARVGARPAVVETLKAEGLSK